MRCLARLLLAVIPVWALHGQPALPVTGPSQWKAPTGCRQLLPEDFHPLTRTERAAIYLQSLIGPQAILFTAVNAGVGTAADIPHEWPANARGFGYRAASSWGQSAISSSFENGIALARGEDNRYFASGEQGTWPRLKYAVESAFLARHDNGTRSISVSAIAGPAAGAAISRAWQPASTRSAADAARSYGIDMGLSVGLNVFREFLPGYLRKLLP